MNVMLSDGWNLAEVATKGRSISRCPPFDVPFVRCSVGQVVDVVQYLRDLGARDFSTDVNLRVRGIPSDGASDVVVLRPCAGLQELYRDDVGV